MSSMLQLAPSYLSSVYFKNLQRWRDFKDTGKACDLIWQFYSSSVLAAVQHLGTFSGSLAPSEPLLSLLRFGTGTIGVGTVQKMVLMISLSMGQKGDAFENVPKKRHFKINRQLYFHTSNTGNVSQCFSHRYSYRSVKQHKADSEPLSSFHHCKNFYMGVE